MWDKCTGVHSPARDLPPEQYELYRDVFTQVNHQGRTVLESRYLSLPLICALLANAPS